MILRRPNSRASIENAPGPRSVMATPRMITLRPRELLRIESIGSVMTQRRVMLAASTAANTAATLVIMPTIRHAPSARASKERTKLVRFESFASERDGSVWTTRVAPIASRSSNSPAPGALPGNPEYSLGTPPPQSQLLLKRLMLLDAPQIPKLRNLLVTLLWYRFSAGPS